MDQSSHRSARIRHLLTAALVAATGLLAPAAAVAQDYPAKVIRLMVGFPPGGGVDTVARVVGEQMARGLGQPVVVENRPGAAGTLGAAAVAKAEPDGYTLLVTPGGHSIFGAMFTSLPFDTVDSFEWISSLMTLPFFVVVPAQSDIQSLGELIARAKAAPGSITYGSAGPGSTHHLGIELLAREAGVAFHHVPFRGDGPVITALLGNTVNFALATPTNVIGNVAAGKLRAIAVTTETRAAALPEVPTVKEAAGLRDFDVRTWFGMAGPAKLPKPILDRLNAEVRKALAVPEVRERLVRLGGEPAATTPAEMRERVARELRMWTRIVEDARIPKQ